MRKELRNRKLLEQCKRIKVLIRKVGQTKAGKEIWGSQYHDYELVPPVSIKRVHSIERKYNIVLPIEYVYYITQVGSGGAGPGNGFIYTFPKVIEKIILGKPSEQLSSIMSDEEWKERFKNDESDRDNGTIILTGMDTTLLAHLIVKGKQAGRVVYLDYDHHFPPVWPKNSFNFLDWCENWFKEILAGYKVNAGNFMYNEIGTEEDLILSFWQHEDRKYKEEVIYSFLKFHFLHPDTISFLKSQKEDFLEAVTYVLGKY